MLTVNQECSCMLKLEYLSMKSARTSWNQSIRLRWRPRYLCIISDWRPATWAYKAFLTVQYNNILWVFWYRSINLTIFIKRNFYLQKFEAPKLLSVYYSQYSVNILWKYERKIKVRFCFIHFFSEHTCSVCTSTGNGPVEGAITSILKHLNILKGYTQKRTLFFFWIFAENFTLELKV